MSEAVLRCAGLAKAFGAGALRVEVLRGLDLELAAGESAAVVGVSGSGKSTLLHLLAGLDRPDAGSVELAGRRVDRLADRQLAALRNRHLGFVYQQHHLLPEFTAQENAALPLRLAGVAPAQALEQAGRLLARVGLARRLGHKPGELSGGERQRAALCRALIMQPDLLLADEPTGSLDRAAAAEVFDLLLELNAERRVALALVTHDPGLARRMQAGYRLLDGRLEREW